MPLDFPTSPTNGQTYNGYVYSTSVGAWQAKPNAQSPFYTSDTPPGNPVVGDSWFNTNDGTMYIYTYDGNSYQWVEHRSQIAKSQVGLVPIAPASIVTASGTATVDLGGTVTFSGTSSISLNGVFNAPYKNFRIVVAGNLIASFSGTELRLRYRGAGTDVSTTSYYGQGIVQSGSSAPAASQWTTGLSYNPLTNLYTGGYGFCVVDVASPNDTVRTLQTDTNMGFAGSGFYSAHAALLDTNISYDGFSLLPGGAYTISGTVKVYGYN